VKEPPSNARIIAELQSITIAIHLGGLDRLPEMMRGEEKEVDGLPLVTVESDHG